MNVHTGKKSAAKNRAKRVTTGQRILAELRNRIVSSEFPPGSRLPTRAELIQRLGTTPVTLQRVFDMLAHEGFVVARGNEGTFVNQKPPHLNRYGLVFPYGPSPDRPWPTFWSALAQEAAAVAKANGYVMYYFYGNETHQDIETYQRLQADVLAHRLAGLMFVTAPHYLAGSPVLDEPGIPRVAIMPAPVFPGVKAVRLGGGLMGMALNRLRVLGRRRVAVITVPHATEHVAAALAAAGFDSPPYWIQVTNPQTPEGAHNAAHLLLAANPDCRPDALVITDDNLVPHATAGLLAAGSAACRDLVVIAHANFPHPTPSQLPAIRLGYDVREIVRACLALMDTQRAGQSGPDLVEIPPQWEDEILAAAEIYYHLMFEMFSN